MRPQASILHLDLDAFFAAVEQRDKPSLRGKPVIVGGVGSRGVVATASYEARAFGVHSAMPMGEARRACPHGAFLSGRFGAYRAASDLVMSLLGRLSPLVEPLSLDEAYVDLAAGGHECGSADGLARLGERLRADVAAATGGLTASVGIASSKFVAKVASEQAKPDGLRVIEPGTELDLITPLPVQVVPGVGPATLERLRRLGVETVADLQTLSVSELRREIGVAWGEALHALAFARDERPVGTPTQHKSISLEDTFPVDVVDPSALHAVIARDAAGVAARLTAASLFARTVTVKVRLPDFTTFTRSRTLVGATDDADVLAGVARGLLDVLDLREGVRLLGVGVSGLTDVAQEALFEVGFVEPEFQFVERAAVPARGRSDPWAPGRDVIHDLWGPGWVWGAGRGRVTVRFETATSGPGPVRTFAHDDPALRPAPEPEVAESASGPGWAGESARGPGRAGEPASGP